MGKGSIAQRIMAGREAESLLDDPLLNDKFDELIEISMRNAVDAPDKDLAWEYLNQIRVIMNVRKLLKMNIDDGLMAQRESEDKHVN